MNSDDDFYSKGTKSLWDFNTSFLPSTSTQQKITTNRRDLKYSAKTTENNKFLYFSSNKKTTKRFYKPIIGVYLTVVLMFFVNFGEALHNNLPAPTDPSILAVFRDIYNGKEVELEKMVF